MRDSEPIEQRPLQAPAPWLHRLLLAAYPRWFRQEFGSDLARYLERQRAEPRYRTWPLGGLRFAWHAGNDAIRTGLSLRLGRDAEHRSALGRWRRFHDYEPLPRGGHHRPTTGDAGTMLDTILRDVRHGLRGLLGNPGYALVFILTLGLGIGANTAMFSAVNGVLLQPLPHEEGDRLLYLRHSARTAAIDNALFSVPEIDDYRQGAPSLGDVAEFSALNFTLLGFDAPRRVRAGIVTGNYFDVMGLSAALGRTIGPEDDGEAAPAVIVLSDRYWKSVFAADPEIVGKTAEINGRIATFVGVAEPAPPYPERTDIYVNMSTSPHHLSASMNTDRIHRMTEVFAKLTPEATVSSARAEVEAITARLHEEYPEAYDAGSGYAVSVTPLKTQLTSRARPTLLLLFVTALFVLLIACANLANLTLARVLRRGHEMAIRTALGCSRAALRRALLVESLLLSLAGAAIGLLVASAGLDLLVAFTSRFTSRAMEISLDTNVLGFTLLAAVGASVFFTLVPPLPSGDHIGGLSGGTRTTAAAGARRAQRVLVVGQIAVSFILLVGAGLLLRTLLHLDAVDPGFDRQEVLAMDIPANAAGRTDDDIRTQYLSILDGVRSLPGVSGAALTSSVPLRGLGISTLWEMDVDGHEPLPGAPVPRAEFRVVSDGYFEAMGIELRRGRTFVGTDELDAADVVVINEAMARTYFGERDPIGQRIAWTDEVIKFLGLSDDWRTVVGVVADTRDAGLDAAIPHVMYTPYLQVTPRFTGSLLVRVNGQPETVLPDVRDTILAHDPNQPIVNVATLAQLGAESVAPRRLNALLLGTFAALALAIAAVGVGGVLAFSVGSRTREFGVRSALGAAPRQVWSAVVVDGVKLAGIGVAIGSFGALLLVRFIAGLLVGVPAFDPVTFVSVGLLLGGVAVGASWLPAWRAASVSPLEAIATE